MKTLNLKNYNFDASISLVEKRSILHLKMARAQDSFLNL